MTWNLPWNGASPFADQTSRMQNWKEVNIWSSTVYSCDMKVDNIILMMFVLNFIEFCFILELNYCSDFHEGRQYFMLMLVLNF